MVSRERLAMRVARCTAVLGGCTELPLFVCVIAPVPGYLDFPADSVCIVTEVCDESHVPLC